MTSVYRLKPDVNRFQYFLTESEKDIELLRMDCTTRASTWSPPSVYIYEPLHQKGNFYSFSSSTLIIDRRATEILYPHLESAGELLPLSYNGEIYTVLNVTECINCLDQQNTEWVLGKDTETNLLIKRYVFHNNRFSESDIFKIPETCKSEILVVEGRKDPRDEFMYAVESADLKGLLFEQIWEG